MPPLVASILSIISLVTNGLVVVYLLRTHRTPEPTTTEQMARMLEIEAEWGSTLDLMSKQLKKLAKRENDALRASQSHEPGALDMSTASKDELRRIARARGLRV